MSGRSRSAASSASPTTTPSPYRWALPPETEPAEDPLLLRLDFHEESVLLTEFGDAACRTRMVSALDVAHALASELDLATGVLPEGVLWWARTVTGTRVAVWRAPRVWTVRLREGLDRPTRRYRLPMPGLVFVCGPARQAPFVFAAKRRPRGADEQLYRTPTYNVFESGQVCTGSHRFPDDPGRIPEEFFRSFFSPVGSTGRGRSRRHPDVGRLWEELHGEATYPLDDLVPHLTVADAMRIGE